MGICRLNSPAVCPEARLDHPPAGAAMQQIADWLEKLNLGQYAQRFAENDIDVSVLRHLTDAIE
jgi:hypothetical protein